MSEVPLEVRPVAPADREWIEKTLHTHWGSPVIVTRGRAHDALALPGFLALHRGRPAGLATYRIEGPACEIVSLNSVVEGIGVGSALVEAVQLEAAQKGCRRLWLVTTNDNLTALRFWQRRGFTLAALHPGAVRESRNLKPQIPEHGQHGIPIRDEIELERAL